MSRLTSYEDALADAWLNGTADLDEADEARETAGLRRAWAIIDAAR
jgi:hypothetical protein